MTWTATRTWTTGELVTAAYANSYWRDDLDHLAAFGVGGSAFSALTPATNIARVAVGSYTGNGSDNRSITGVGFTPKHVSIFVPGANSPLVFRNTTPAGDNGNYADTNAYIVQASNTIQALNSDGFEIGTATSVNFNGNTYYYMAIG